MKHTPPLYLRLVVVRDHVRETAFAAVIPVLVGGHKDASAAHFSGALLAEPLNLAVLVDLVEFEHSEGNLLAHVLCLLGLGVRLLLALFATTTKAEHKVKVDSSML